MLQQRIVCNSVHHWLNVCHKSLLQPHKGALPDMMPDGSVYVVPRAAAARAAFCY